MVNDRVKMAERGSARDAERVLRTRELMQSGPVAESESRVVRNFSTFSDAKDIIQEQLGTTGKDGYTEGGVRDTIIWSKYIIDAFGLFTSGVGCGSIWSEERDGRGAFIPGMDLTRCHQVLEEGDDFESSFLRWDRCCFLALYPACETQHLAHYHKHQYEVWWPQFRCSILPLLAGEECM